VLRPANRLRRSTDFASVVRSGTRARRGTVVVHHLAQVTPGGEPLVGFVVSKSVGNSVVRHQVSRRLRAQVVDRLDDLPRGSGTVVRALPSAAQANSARLGTDLAAALRNLRLGADVSRRHAGNGPADNGPADNTHILVDNR
jgi:ribonuclease P protein component